MKQIVFFLFLALFATPFQALAAVNEGLIPCGSTGQPACTLCDLFKLGNNIISFFLFPTASNGYVPVVALIAGFFIVVGGFYLFIGGANPDNQRKGKTILFSVAIGLLVVYTAWVVIEGILAFMGVAEWTGLRSWWQISCQ